MVFFRAEYTKEIVNPVLGEQGVGGAMAIYGVFDAIVSFTRVVGSYPILACSIWNSFYRTHLHWSIFFSNMMVV